MRAIGGFFFVLDGEGKEWRTKARGKLRRQVEELLVGDRVRCRCEEDGIVVDEVLPRRNQLQRPPVANVDQVLIVMACDQPVPHWLLLDRLLIMAQQQRIEPLIFFNKTDLVSAETLASYLAYYRPSGFRLLCGSEQQDEGIRELREAFRGKLTVVAGPSGVGKSSLLNRLYPSWELETGALTRKLARGKHTTRKVELFVLPERGMVADTPGFYALETQPVTRRELAFFYPEMRAVLGECRFGSSCLHDAEPDCAVKELLKQGGLSALRYQNYLTLLQEMKEQENRYE